MSPDTSNSSLRYGKPQTKGDESNTVKSLQYLNVKKISENNERLASVILNAERVTAGGL